MGSGGAHGEARLGAPSAPADRRLRPSLRVRAIPPDLVFFLADEDALCVRGSSWVRLAPHLEGSLEADGLARRSGLLREEVEAALAALAGQGLMADAGAGLESPPPRPLAEDSAEATDVPAGAQGSGTVGPTFVVHGGVSGLANLSLPAGAPLPGADARSEVHLVVVDDYLDPELGRLVEELPAGLPWLPVKASGERIWIGPLFRPDDGGPCPGCLGVALARSRPVAALYYRLQPRSEPVRRAEPRRLHALPGQIARRLDDGSLAATLWVLDPASGRGEPHRLHREPDCPRCGAPAGSRAEPSPVPRPIRHRSDGGFRIEEPAATVRHLAPFVDRLTGIVRNLSVRPAATGEPQVAVAAYPHPVPAASWAELRARPRVAAAGKGTTRSQAVAGAVAEAIERSDGVIRGDEPRRLATAAELGGEALRPSDLLLYSAGQLAEGAASALDDDQPTEWTALRSLRDGGRRWMPTSLAWYGYTPPDGGWSHPADSNGCAAGRCREEAILQGLLELVERDAAALWWYNALDRPALDPHDHPAVDAVRTLCAGRGLSLHLVDLTSDLGIAVVVALAVDAGRKDLRLGFGAHLDAGLAVGRAVTELAQFLPAPGGTTPADRRAASVVPSWLAESLRRPERAATPPGELDRPAPVDDFATALDTVLGRLARAGLEACALDQTRRPELLHVVRVVVPGLRPWYRRLGPGRLYDVPVAMGWVEIAREEHQMEPQPLYRRPSEPRSQSR